MRVVGGMFLLMSAGFSCEVSAGMLDYFLDPAAYWAEQSAAVCTDANMLLRDYQTCMANKERNKAGGAFLTDWDRVCSVAKKDYLVKREDCFSANARFEAEVEKKRIENEK